MTTAEGMVLVEDSKGRQFSSGVEYKLSWPSEMESPVAYQLLIEDFHKHIEECKKFNIR